MSQTEHYNILIVDDHPLVRKGLRQLILAGAGTDGHR